MKFHVLFLFHFHNFSRDDFYLHWLIHYDNNFIGTDSLSNKITNSLRIPALILFFVISGIGPYPNFATGSGVWAELELAANCQKCLLQNGFRETGNVDFVKRILLEGTGMDPDQFLRIREVRNKFYSTLNIQLQMMSVLPTLSDQNHD